MLLNQTTGGPLSAFVNADISSFDLNVTDEELVDSLLNNMHKYFFVEFCQPNTQPYFAQEIYVNVLQDFVLVNFANEVIFENCFFDKKIWQIFSDVMFRRTGHCLFYEIHNASIH